MRRSLLLLTILLPLILIGQPIQMFTDPTAKWYVADTYPNGSPEAPGFAETMTTIYFYDGDTILDDLVWLELYSLNGPDPSSLPVREGWVRLEDDLILFHDTADLVHILYDHGLQIGDSVPYRLYGPDTTFLQVSSIETVTLQGNDHQMVHFGEPPNIAMDVLNERWIEGLGSMHGPLFPVYPRTFMTEVPGDSLVFTCFYVDDSLYWQHPGFAECETNIIQSFEEHFDDLDLGVWPNPGSDQLNINWSASNYSPLQIEIYSMLGELVRSETVTTFPNTVSTDDLPAGCYSIHLIDHRNRFAVKWMKQ